MNAAADTHSQAGTTCSLESGVPPVPPEDSPKAGVEGVGSGAVGVASIEAIKHADFLPEARRVYLASLFGAKAVEQFEAAVHINAWRLCKDYRHCPWSLWKLSNGAFFLAPRMAEPVRVELDTHCGALSARAFGIAVTLVALRSICWIVSYQGQHLDLRAALRAFALQQAEADAILQLLD